MGARSSSAWLSRAPRVGRHAAWDTVEVTSPTPGWYPDPHVPQQMRWWDGSHWTEDTYERAEPVQQWGAPAVAVVSPHSATTDDGVPLAGWWRRAVARLLDLVITGVIAWLVGFSQARVVLGSVAEQLNEGVRSAQQGSPAPAFQYDVASVKALAVLSLVWLAVSLVYDLVFLRWLAATPGKLALGLVVRPWTPGERLTTRAIALRWLGFEVGTSLPYVGTFYLVADVLWPLRDARRQALHDKYAGTCVVRKR